MPTLGPLFRWLRPSQWGKHAEHIELGRKTNHYDDAEAFQRVWPRIHDTRTTPDDSLMNGSITDPSEPVEKGFGGFSHWTRPGVSREQSARSELGAGRVGNPRPYSFGVRKDDLQGDRRVEGDAGGVRGRLVGAGDDGY